MANKPTAKKNASAKGGAKKSAAPARTQTRMPARAPHAAVEIIGIILLALGALFAVYLYSGNEDWLGEIISGYLLGMHGMFAYAVPVIFVIVGIYLIVGGRKKPARGTLITGLLTVWFILCAFHLVTSQELRALSTFGDGKSFVDYIKQFFGQFPAAWKEGVNTPHIGGGVLGMILPTLLWVIGKELLCWVVIVAGFLISVLLCTGISIKAYTDAFGTKVRERIAEHEQARSEGYGDEYESVPARKPWKDDFVTTIDESSSPARKKPAERKKSGKIPFAMFSMPTAR